MGKNKNGVKKYKLEAYFIIQGENKKVNKQAKKDRLPCNFLIFMHIKTKIIESKKT